MARENRKLLIELADLVLDAQEQTDHYIGLDFSNYGWDVCVRVKLGS